MIIVLSVALYMLSNMGYNGAMPPKDLGPYKTLYNRFVRWSTMGIFNKIFSEFVIMQNLPEHLQIDATHLKAHRTAASLLKKRVFSDVLVALKVKVG